MQQPAIRGAGNRLTGRHIIVVSFAAGLQFHSEVSSKTKLFIIKNNKKE
jgi:hypothetical protein